MSEDRTKLEGEKFEFFRNDKPWEGGLVEGVSILKRNGYYYAIYAADGCCGTGCTYATGVARAKTLQGPWEKFSGNPILTNNDTWKCPGHGTAVQDDKGRYFFLYHAYRPTISSFQGGKACSTNLPGRPMAGPSSKIIRPAKRLRRSWATTLPKKA